MCDWPGCCIVGQCNVWLWHTVVGAVVQTVISLAQWDPASPLTAAGDFAPCCHCHVRQTVLMTAMRESIQQSDTNIGIQYYNIHLRNNIFCEKTRA